MKNLRILVLILLISLIVSLLLLQRLSLQRLANNLYEDQATKELYLFRDGSVTIDGSTTATYRVMGNRVQMYCRHQRNRTYFGYPETFASRREYIKEPTEYMGLVRHNSIALHPHSADDNSRSVHPFLTRVDSSRLREREAARLAQTNRIHQFLDEWRANSTGIAATQMETEAFREEIRSMVRPGAHRSSTTPILRGPALALCIGKECPMKGGGYCTSEYWTENPMPTQSQIMALLQPGETVRFEYGYSGGTGSKGCLLRFEPKEIQKFAESRVYCRETSSPSRPYKTIVAYDIEVGSIGQYQPKDGPSSHLNPVGLHGILSAWFYSWPDRSLIGTTVIEELPPDEIQVETDPATGFPRRKNPDVGVAQSLSWKFHLWMEQNVNCNDP